MAGVWDRISILWYEVMVGGACSIQKPPYKTFNFLVRVDRHADQIAGKIQSSV